jgi:hypothetical protein
LIRVLVALALSIALLAPSARAAHAQDVPEIASLSLTPTRATVGDRIQLTIEVDHNTSTMIEGPGADADFGQFELIEIAEPRDEARTGTVRTTLGYTLAAFAIGSVELPPLTLRWRGDGEGTLTTESEQIVIESVLVPGDEELRPLKPQLDIADDAPPPIVPALYVAIFAALTAFGYVLVARAIRERPDAPAPAVPRPAHTPAERARASLDALAGTHADAPAHYASIAAIVRRYLSERYGFAAYAMTRRELQRHMTREDLGRWPARLVANLLEQCDAVQFAGFTPAPERAVADLTAAYEIVDLTEPQAETTEQLSPAT